MHNHDSKVIGTEVFQALVENSNDAVLLFTDDDRLFYANRKAKQLLSIPEFSTNQHVSELLPDALFDVIERVDPTAGESPTIKEADVRFPDGTRSWLETTLATISIGEQVFQHVGLRDINRLKQRESKLRLEASTDFLSGLSNRRQFRKVLDQHANDKICLAVVDVDNFKIVNDSFGHVTGDTAIRFVAETLLDFFGDEFCVARLGGEEFGVVTKYSRRDEVVELFDAFRKAIEFGSFIECNSRSEQTVTLTVSVGLAFSAQIEGDISGLLVKADEALYDSKDNGRNRVTVSN